MFYILKKGLRANKRAGLKNIYGVDEILLK